MHQTVEKYKKIDEQWAETSYLPMTLAMKSKQMAGHRISSLSREK